MQCFVLQLLDRGTGSFHVVEEKGETASSHLVKKKRFKKISNFLEVRNLKRGSSKENPSGFECIPLPGGLFHSWTAFLNREISEPKLGPPNSILSAPLFCSGDFQASPHSSFSQSGPHPRPAGPALSSPCVAQHRPGARDPRPWAPRRMLAWPFELFR